MDGGNIVAKKTKLPNSDYLGSGNYIEVDLRHLLVRAIIWKPIPGSLKCVPCSPESWGLMT